MTTLKKRLLIAAAALAFLTAGAAIGNTASAASDEGRDYRISLYMANNDHQGEPPHMKKDHPAPPPHHMKKDRPAPPPHKTKEYRENHKDQYKPDKKDHKHNKADWDKKHDKHQRDDGRHMPPEKK